MNRAAVSGLAVLLILQLSPLIARAQGGWVKQQPTPTTWGHGHIVRDSAGNVIMASMYGSVTKFRASDGAVLWTANAGTYGQLAIDSSDNVYTSFPVEHTDIDGTVKTHLRVTKVSPSGSTVWTTETDIGSVSEHASAGAIVLGSNGTLYALGTPGNQSQPTAPAVLTRLSMSTGALQSTPAVVGAVPDYGGDMPLNSLKVDSANNVYWAGPSGLTKYSSTVTTPLHWSGAQQARAVGISGTSVLVTGAKYIGGNEYQMYVAKLASATLSTTWMYTFPAQVRDEAYPGLGDLCYPENYTTYGGNALAVDASGNVYVAGDAVSSDGSFTGGTFAKLNSSGQLLWSQHVGHSGLDSACFDIALGANGRVVASCSDMQLGNESSTAIAVISDQNGNQLESFANDGPGGEDDAFDHLVIGSSGTLYLLDESGYIGSNGSQTFVPTIFEYTMTGL